MTSADHDRPDERRGIVRRVLSQGPDPEERIEELLAVRRRELEEHGQRLHESIAELERREELLRDSRASVERMLRLGTSELEAREAELTDYVRGLTQREAELARAEEDIARRRQELGAVELKRAAVEARERALEAREIELSERERSLAEASGASEQARLVELAFVQGARYALVDLEPVELLAGSTFELAAEAFAVIRVGPSPLPNDPRRCAYLVRGLRDVDDAPSGSS
jgi:chromosome segregation ATPase